MASDAVLALARATVDGQTLFGQTSDRADGRCQPLCRTPSRAFAADEKLRTQFLELPQARQTHAVLGCRPDGLWGYEHGINEQQVAVGCVALQPTLTCQGQGLLGSDLVRLTLERSRTARQAVDLLTNLVERYGQGAFPDCPAEAERDNAFLIADPTEAYALEAAGHYWVYQEVQEVRAVSNVRVIRQDWDRISHGLAAHAIGQGWWPDDGSKLDFAGALGENPPEHAPAMRRWGRATLMLLEQNGHIDAAFVRRVLNGQSDESSQGVGPVAVGEHGVKWYKDSPGSGKGDRTFSGPETARRELAFKANTASFVASLTRDPARMPVAWCAFGTACAGVSFPVFLEGEVPEPFTHARPQPSLDSLWGRVSRLSERLQRDPERRALVQDSFARLQARFDQEAEEFMVEGAALKQRGASTDLQRQATLFMQYNLERFEGVLADALRTRPLAAVDS